VYCITKFEFFFFFTLCHSSYLYPMTESTTSIENPSEGVTPYPGWGQSDHQNADLKIISSNNFTFWVSSTQLVHHS
jgi:hypothetical protein